MLITALQKANIEQKLALDKWIATNNDDEAKIKAVSQLYIETGAMEYCKNLSKTYFDKAVQYLNLLENVDPQAKKQLFEIAQLIINRNF